MTTRSTNSTILSMISTLIEYARFGVQVCKVMSGQECTHMEIPKGITYLNKAYEVIYRKVPHLSGKHVISINNDTFVNCKSTLKSASFPKILTIPAQGFFECKLLESVDLSWATQVGGGAFNNCTSLTELNLPYATTLSSQIIRGSGIKIIRLPKVEKMPYQALMDAPALEEAYLESVTTTESDWLTNCPKLKKLYVGRITSFGNYFVASTELEYIGIKPGSTSRINIYKFPKLTEECLIQLFENYADFTKIVGSLTLQLTQEQYENIEGYLFMLDEKNINYEVV